MEVDVAGGVDEIQLVALAVEDVIDRDGTRFDGDPALAFEVHVVEQLLAELALGDRAGLEQELIGERAFAVVDVRHDREVSDEFRVDRHNQGPGPRGNAGAAGIVPGRGNPKQGTSLPL